MAPSEGSSSRPQITLEPLQNAKRIQSIQQWVSAFNIFVSVYSEKFTAGTPRIFVTLSKTRLRESFVALKRFV